MIDSYINNIILKYFKVKHSQCGIKLINYLSLTLNI